MATPGQGLVADAQAPRAGMLGEQAQVVHQQLFVAQGVGLDIAAHQHQVGAQFLHQVELALGAVEILAQAVTAAALEIAERLEQGDGQPQVGAQLAHLAGAAGVVQQVVLEDLDAVETGGGDGLEFFRQGAAQGNGGDRTVHGGCSLLLSEAWHDRLFAGKVAPATNFVRNS